MAPPLPPAQLEYFQKHASDNQQPNLIATIVLCLVMPCIAVFMRFLARWRTQAGYMADDWLVLLALLPCAGMSTTTGLDVRFGEGRHIIFVNNPEGFVKIYVAGIVVYSLTIIFVKLSILYLYHRIFPAKSLFMMACLIGALVLAYSAALIIFAFLQCIPLSKLWSGKPGGVCAPTQPAFVTLAVMNVVTDLMILCLPIKYVVHLQMKTTRKLQVLGAFSLGGIVCIFGIVRAYYVGQASSTDQSWTATPGAIWSQVEIAVGIISACLPVYRPLFTPRSKLSKSKSATYNSKPVSNFRSIPLANRNTVFGSWSTNVASADGPDDDLDVRSFVKLSSPEAIHQEASFTVATGPR